MKYLPRELAFRKLRAMVDGRAPRPQGRSVTCPAGRSGPVTRSPGNPDRVEVRGRDLAGDLMGRLTFTEYFHLLLTGDEPTERAAVLPRPPARRDRRARADADERRRAHDARGRPRLAAGRRRRRDPRRRAGPPRRVRRSARACSRPGQEPPESPAISTPRAGKSRASATRFTSRSTRAPSESSSSRTNAASPGATWPARASFTRPSRRRTGKPLTMNVSLPIAAVHARPRLLRRARSRPCRSSPARRACSRTSPRSGSGRSASCSPAPRRGRRARVTDDELYRAQVAYLLERSPFYREKLAGHEPGGLDEIAELPLTEKDELRATRTRENPIGAHLCADASELVRIYSTSGTTGTPSYVPLTARRPGQLGHRLGAQLRRVRRRAGRADRLDLQRRPVRRRRRARRLRADRPRPHPRRHGEHRAPAARDRAARAGRGRAHAVVRGLPDRAGGGARRRPRADRASSACSWRASRAVASPRFARSSRRAGARRSRRRWASATSASRSGASARSRTGCTSARTASSTRS